MKQRQKQKQKSRQKQTPAAEPKPGIPVYTACVQASVEAFALKCRGALLDDRVRALQAAPRSRQWADEVERICAAMTILPAAVRERCQETQLLDTLRQEIAAVRSSYAESIRAKAKEIEAIVSAAYEPKPDIPSDPAGRFSEDCCIKAEEASKQRIAWCRAAIAYEKEYPLLSEQVRSCIPDTRGFDIAPCSLRAAMVDAEVFAIFRTVMLASDYNFLSQIALMETKFNVLTDAEKQQTFCAPYLEAMIGIFKTCILIEEKIAKDPVYGQRVYKEKRTCMKHHTPFVCSAVFRQCKKPEVQSVLRSTERKQCTF